MPKHEPKPVRQKGGEIVLVLFKEANVRSKAKSLTFIWRIFPPVLVFALAAFVYSQYGLYADLGRTNGIVLYSGQKMAEGIPHYVSIFDVITPWVLCLQD